MTKFNNWAEFGEGRYPDCHWEGKQWPGSMRELVLEGFADGTYLRQLYPIRSIETALSVKEETKIKKAESKTCSNCASWIEIDASTYEGICSSDYSLASTVETVEAKFTCPFWEEKEFW